MRRREILCGFATTGITACGFFSSSSQVFGERVVKDIRELKPGEFTWHPERSPEGPVSIVVSIPDQRVHVYRNGIRIGVSTCSTGAPGHSTPTGVFTILEKDRNHRSSTYNNAPMPNMNRLTWSGIAIHAGNLPGYPASHGCIRLPVKFSEVLFGVTHVGTPVILAGSHADPVELVHPGLILASYASHEFARVTGNLKGKSNPWAAQVVDFSKPATILISGAERRGVMIVEGEVIGEAAISIADPEQPLGSHVMVLVDEHHGASGMRWHAIAHHAEAGASLAAAAETVVRRISAAPEVQAEVEEHMHPGMTLVTTDLPLHADTRSGRDFVVMGQEA